ncbi:MAG: MFS transporter, partial [Traorella sp.]
ANEMKSISFFIIALALTLISMQSYRSPAVALMPDLTPKPLLSKANAIINLMGTIGGVISLLLIKALVPEGSYNYFPLFVSVATLMLLCVAILFITIKEKTLADEIKDNQEEPEEIRQTNNTLPADVSRSLKYLLYSIAFWFMAYNAVTTAFSRYAAFVWNKGAGGSATLLLIATIAATIAYIPIGQLSSKFGRRKMIRFGVLLLTASFGVAFMIRELNLLAYLVFCLVGIAWASINVNSYPMVVSMASIGDTGKYTGIYYTFSMAAQIITPILSGVFIDLLGYLSLFPYAAICSLCAFVTFMQVKHGDIEIKPKEGVE